MCSLHDFDKLLCGTIELAGYRPRIKLEKYATVRGVLGHRSLRILGSGIGMNLRDASC
jgi:hypothetical protein